jgi:hypothetical protein
MFQLEPPQSAIKLARVLASYIIVSNNITIMAEKACLLHACMPAVLPAANSQHQSSDRWRPIVNVQEAQAKKVCGGNLEYIVSAAACTSTGICVTSRGFNADCLNVSRGASIDICTLSSILIWLKRMQWWRAR